MSTSATATEPTPQDTPGGDRVREHTEPDRLRSMDAELRQRVERYKNASDPEILARIEELESESDMERVLETNASILTIVGVVAGAFVDRRFLALPAVVMAFLLQHARQGWCPPMPIFRRFGTRTRQEIDAEKYALKAIRGDFAELTPN